MPMKKLITKWTGLYGEKIRVDDTYYDVSGVGECEVSEEHALKLTATAGWIYKPQKTALSKAPPVPSPMAQPPLEPEAKITTEAKDKPKKPAPGKK